MFHVRSSLEVLARAEMAANAIMLWIDVASASCKVNTF